MKNKMVLYCKTLEQAMLVEICKKKRCDKSSCLFRQVVTKLGRDDFFSPVPRRYSSLEEIEKDQDLLVYQDAVDTEDSQVREIFPPSRPARLPLHRKEIAPKKMTTMTDILKKEIETMLRE